MSEDIVRLILLSALTLLFSPFLSCNRPSETPVVRQSTAMNTYLTISIYDPDKSPDAANSWIDSCFSEIRRVERIATDYNDTSEVGTINSHAGIDTVQVSDEIARLLRFGIRYGELSEWRLDVTIKPLVKAWDFVSATPHSPPKSTITKLLPLVDARLLSINGNNVYLPKRGMGIDLGSFGKGYAIDRSVAILQKAGFSRFIVDIGGELGVQWDGTHLLDSTAAEVLVRHPRRQGEYLGKFRMGSGAVSTSGDYEHYFVEDGVRYHHLLDPRTGYPMRGVVSVTLVTDNNTFADAMSTIVFLLGREKGMSLINATKNVEGMIVYESGDSLAYDCSPRFRQCFSPTDAND